MNQLTNNQYVSRGGLKLQHALDEFKVSVNDLTVLDIGSSTGGFVDCLLQNGAAKVYALDTAYGELAWKLRNDPRVVVMERTNILHLTGLPGHPEHSEGSRANAGRNKSGDSPPAQTTPSSYGSRNDFVKVDLITIDAGWTRLELILPIAQKYLKEDGRIIALLKPHYEAEKKDLVKGVLPEEISEKIKEQVIEKIKKPGFEVKYVIDSPILGGAGNREYLLLISS